MFQPSDFSDMVTPKTNIVNMNPSKDSQTRNHVIVTPEQTMMIMADLSPRDRFVRVTFVHDA